MTVAYIEYVMCFMMQENSMKQKYKLREFLLIRHSKYILKH